MGAEEKQAFEARVQRHRRELHVHCYRMVASFHDADDLVQETLLRAWRARETFDPADTDTGFRAWLYRIATNACLDFLRSTPRQVSARSFAEVPWLQPYPDHLLDELPAPGTPEGAAVDKETIALGYLALIQSLPPRQRAILILRDLLDWSAADTASLLETSVAAANSGLQRARETMQASRGSGDASPAREPTERERALLAAFIDAHQRADVGASVALMREDIRVTMPPLPACYEGRDAVTPLLTQAFGGMGEWRLVPAWANRQPAAVSYLRRPGDAVYRALKIDVLRAEGGLIKEVTTFDTRLLASFGLPKTLAP